MERLTERYVTTDNENEVWVHSHDYIGASKRLADYEDTGLTPTEITELKERDTAKEPDYEGDGCDKNGNIIYDTWICPNCGTKYEVDYDEYEHCPKCGQAIRWENLEGMENENT